MKRLWITVKRTFKNSILFPSHPDHLIDKVPAPGSPVFVLVHGTWARDAEWTSVEAELGRALVGDEVHPGVFPEAGWVRFVWHAYNGARARTNAAIALACVIDNLQFPNSPIIAIAHSHGGNVVAWASTRTRDDIEGAVYLNAPFFHIKLPVRTKNGDLDQSKMKGSIFIATALAPALALGYIVQRYNDVDPWPAEIKTFALVLGLTWLIGTVVAFPLAAVAAKAVKPTMEVLWTLSSAKRKVMYELSVFCVGDEADLGLTTSTGIDRVIKAVVTSVICAASLAVWVFFLAAWITDDWSILGKYVLPVSAVMLGAGVLGILGEPVVALSQGLEQGAIAIDAQITVSSAPTGTVEFLTVPWPDSEPPAGIHASVYSDPKSVAAIASSLRRRFGATEGEANGPPSL